MKDGHCKKCGRHVWIHDRSPLVLCGHCQQVADLTARVERLRLERDILALNFGQKESGVSIIFDGEDVVGIGWVDGYAASDHFVKLPSYYEAATPTKE